MAEAGWYPDPQEPGFVQFFDGREWTGERRPLPSEAPAGGSGAQPTQHVGTSPWSSPTAPAQASPAQHAPQPAWSQPGSQPGPQWAQTAPSDPTVQRVPAGPQPPSAPAPGTPWQPAGPTPPPTAARKSHSRLIIGIVAVLAVAGGLVAWLLWPRGNSDSLTFNGKSIAEPSAVLAGAEEDVAALVGTRHGSKNASTRCYFAQPKTTPAGQPSSDIEQTVWCGPVLFVDGDPSQNYLAIPLMSGPASGSSNSVSLRTAPGISSIQPQSLDSTLDYVRPDGLTPPKTVDLSTPKPPAADQDVLTTAPLGPVPAPKALADARMVGRTASVTLAAAGEVARFGQGDNARSAPSGEKLYAFRVEYGRGDIGHAKVTAEFVVDNGTPRPLPVALNDDWIIAAVPDGSSAQIVLDNAGYEQSLSIPDGKPGPDNIAVLVRSHRESAINTTASIPVHLASGSGSADVTWNANVSTAELNFWIPGHMFRHPTSAGDAVLSVHANYHYSDTPSTTYGFDPELLRLRLPDGTLLKAENVAGKNKINDVFVVPADFTEGTLEIGGHEKVGDVMVTISRSVQVPISIPAG